MIYIPRKLLEDPEANRLLVDALQDLSGPHIVVVDEQPGYLTEQPVILYNRSDQTLLICDTTKWREFGDGSDKADIDHAHDERYYTEAEADALLAAKGDTGHVHTEADITDLDKYTQSEADTLLAAKSDDTHTHATFASLDIGGGGDKTAIDATGHQTMEGAARPWRDELGELIGKKFKGARISENTDEGTLDFADNCVSADDFVITNVQLNHDKDLAAALYPHLHWFHASAEVPNWLLQYRWQVNGAAKVTDWTPLKMNTTVHEYSSGTIHQICHCVPIAVPAGSDLSDIVQFRISRDTANVSTLFDGLDPLIGAASAMSFDVHFQINSLGSDDEYSK